MRRTCRQRRDIRGKRGVRDGNPSTNISSAATTSAVGVAVADAAAVPARVITIARDTVVVIRGAAAGAACKDEERLAGGHWHSRLHSAALARSACIRGSAALTTLRIDLQPGHTGGNRISLRSPGVVKNEIGSEHGSRVKDIRVRRDAIGRA